MAEELEVVSGALASADWRLRMGPSVGSPGVGRPVASMLAHGESVLSALQAHAYSPIHAWAAPQIGVDVRGSRLGTHFLYFGGGGGLDGQRFFIPWLYIPFGLLRWFDWLSRYLDGWADRLRERYGELLDRTRRETGAIHQMLSAADHKRKQYEAARPHIFKVLAIAGVGLSGPGTLPESDTTRIMQAFVSCRISLKGALQLIVYTGMKQVGASPEAIARATTEMASALAAANSASARPAPIGPVDNR